jgi:hypothetical protein
LIEPQAAREKIVPELFYCLKFFSFFSSPLFFGFFPVYFDPFNQPHKKTGSATQRSAANAGWWKYQSPLANIKRFTQLVNHLSCFIHNSNL